MFISWEPATAIAWLIASLWAEAFTFYAQFRGKEIDLNISITEDLEHKSDDGGKE